MDWKADKLAKTASDSHDWYEAYYALHSEAEAALAEARHSVSLVIDQREAWRGHAERLLAENKDLQAKLAAALTQRDKAMDEAHWKGHRIATLEAALCRYCNSRECEFVGLKCAQGIERGRS